MTTSDPALLAMESSQLRVRMAGLRRFHDMQAETIRRLRLENHALRDLDIEEVLQAKRAWRQRCLDMEAVVESQRAEVAALTARVEALGKLLEVNGAPSVDLVAAAGPGFPPSSGPAVASTDEVVR